MRRGTKNQWRFHGFAEPPCLKEMKIFESEQDQNETKKTTNLFCDLVLFFARKGSELIVFGANEEGNCGLREVLAASVNKDIIS